MSCRNRRKRRNSSSEGISALSTVSTPPEGASARFARALQGLAEDGRRPLCAEIGPHGPWLSDDPDEREHARSLCAGCEVLTLCLDAAVEERTSFGTRGGRDFTRPAPRATSKTA